MQQRHRVYTYLDDYFQRVKERSEFEAGYRSMLGKWMREGINEKPINGHGGYFPTIEFTSIRVLDNIRRVELALSGLKDYEPRLYQAVVLAYCSYFIAPSKRRLNASYYAGLMSVSVPSYHIFLRRGLDWLDAKLVDEQSARREKKSQRGLANIRFRV